MPDLNRLYLDPSKDDAIANEFAGLQPGESGTLTVQYTLESYDPEMLVLSITGIQSDVQQEEEEPPPPPEDSPVALVIDQDTPA